MNNVGNVFIKQSETEKSLSGNVNKVEKKDQKENQKFSEILGKKVDRNKDVKKRVKVTGKKDKVVKKNKIKEIDNSNIDIEEMKKEILLLIDSLFIDILKKENSFELKNILNKYFNKSGILDDKNIKILENISLLNYKKIVLLLSELKKSLSSEKIGKFEKSKMNVKMMDEKDDNSIQKFADKFRDNGKLTIKKSYKSIKNIHKYQVENSPIKFNNNSNIKGAINLIHSNLSKNDNIVELKEVAQSNQPKIDIDDIFEKIVQKAKVTLMDNKSEIVIKLKPEFLGKMTMKLELSGNKLSGKIMVDNKFTQKLFVENFHQLKVAFQDMGLSVENFDIGLNNYQDFNFAENKGNNDKVSFGNRVHISGEEIDDISAHNISDNYETVGWLANNVNLVA